MCLLVLIFLLSVKGTKGPIGPIGDLGTKGVEVISLVMWRRCVYSFFMLRDKFTTEKCVLCGVDNRLFCLTGRFRRKRWSRRLGSSRRDGELLLLTEIDKNKLMCSSLLRTNVFFVWHWREREVVLETRDLPDRKESGLVCLLLPIYHKEKDGDWYINL